MSQEGSGAMDRSIIKRELKESFAWMYRDKRTGKPHRLWKTILHAVLYAIAFAWLMHIFYEMAQAMCLPMMALDLEWLSFVLMGLLSLCVVGLTNTLHAYSALNRLKEETILPDGPKAIGAMLWAKFSGTYIMGLFYSLVFMIPGVIVHLQYAKPNPIGFVFTLCIPIALGLLSLVISCFAVFTTKFAFSSVKFASLIVASSPAISDFSSSKMSISETTSLPLTTISVSFWISSGFFSASFLFIRM